VIVLLNELYFFCNSTDSASIKTYSLHGTYGLTEIDYRLTYRLVTLY